MPIQHGMLKERNFHGDFQKIKNGKSPLVVLMEDGFLGEMDLILLMPV